MTLRSWDQHLLQVTLLPTLLRSSLSFSTFFVILFTMKGSMNTIEQTSLVLFSYLMYLIYYIGICRPILWQSIQGDGERFF